MGAGENQLWLKLNCHWASPSEFRFYLVIIYSSKNVLSLSPCTKIILIKMIHVEYFLILCYSGDFIMTAWLFHSLHLKQCAKVFITNNYFESREHYCSILQEYFITVFLSYCLYSCLGQVVIEKSYCILFLIIGLHVFLKLLFQVHSVYILLYIYI